MYIKVNEVKIEVSDAYTSGQNQASFVINNMAADEATEALSGVSSFEFFNDDDSVQKAYENMALVSVSNVPVPGGIEGDVKVDVVVTFRQKSDLEVRVEALESSQGNQDEAIAELAVMIAE